MKKLMLLMGLLATLWGCKSSSTVVKESTNQKEKETITEKILPGSDLEITWPDPIGPITPYFPPDSGAVWQIDSGFWFTPQPYEPGQSWGLPWGQQMIPQLVPDTIIKVDPRTGVELRMWKDRYNRLLASCTSPEEKIIYRDREVLIENSSTSEKDTTRRVVPWWFWVIVGVLILWLLAPLIKPLGRW